MTGQKWEYRCGFPRAPLKVNSRFDEKQDLNDYEHFIFVHQWKGLLSRRGEQTFRVTCISNYLDIDLMYIGIIYTTYFLQFEN
mmetsp:Transcript_51413/g.160449  ORF Transcript_51413/g.160449 Transcript_51413/m.160449 type:complete len:83 (+) Transcript_51413:496-744(+)